MGGSTPADEWTALLPGFLLAGAGVGLDQPGDRRRGGVVVPKEQSGMASGINDTFRQVGIAIGIAAWGAIFLGRGADKVEQLAGGHAGSHRRPAAPAGRGGLVGQPRRRAGHRARRQPAAPWRDAAREGFLSGLNEILMLGGILALAGAVAALWLVRERDIERSEPVEVELPYLGRGGARSRSRRKDTASTTARAGPPPGPAPRVAQAVASRPPRSLTQRRLTRQSTG